MMESAWENANPDPYSVKSKPAANCQKVQNNRTVKTLIYHSMAMPERKDLTPYCLAVQGVSHSS